MRTAIFLRNLYDFDSVSVHIDIAKSISVFYVVNLRYGRVEISAKMPVGDWLWPGNISRTFYIF